MNLFEEALIYSTVMHTGAVRKGSNTPYILHPMEVAQIVSTLTDDIDVITAAILHDVVEDTDGSLREVRARFGDHVAELVDSITENKYADEDSRLTWRRRKEENIALLRNTRSLDVKILWLADTLSNMRAMAGQYSEKGEELWKQFHQSDPAVQLWYYRSIAETLEIDLNRSAAFKELIKHINFIWPETFKSEKTKYKKYREVSIDGCEVIGHGAKSVVYRYDDELIIKVYNEKNAYKDIERENRIARRAFVAGLPTAICFGIVKVGDSYGSMFEFLNSSSISTLISRDISKVSYYADMMADLARTIHTTSLDADELSDYMSEVYEWVEQGVGYFEPALAEKLTAMLRALPEVSTLIHGDFHTGNVLMQNSEPMLIDIDRLSVCHPIVELAGIHMSYVGFGELDHSVSKFFLGFDYEVQQQFYDEFMRHYLNTDDEERIQAVKDKAALLSYVRLIRRVYKTGGKLNQTQLKVRDYYLNKVNELITRVDSFDF